MPKNKKSYTPAPQVPPELMQRLALVLEVLSGSCTVSQAARALGLSRNHFQTILHRGLTGLVEGIERRPGGRPAKAQELAALEAELAQLRRENARLLDRVGTTERLLQAASGLLQGRLRPAGRQVRSKRTKAPADEKAEPDAAQRRKLEVVKQMKGLGLGASLAAAVAGVHASSVRRWRARERRGEPLVSSRAPSVKPALAPAEARDHAGEIVRRLHGLVGADSLRRSVPGISRRAAARVKADTLSDMERERKGMLTRVTVTVPGVMRGLDGMYLHGADGAAHALFSADAAVPYRTGVKVGTRYDAKLVARALASDMEQNGAPLVYRLDRASAHDAPAVRELLAAHRVLVLHGPPHCPRFYGQHERQNREHRAWDEELALVPIEDIELRLKDMLVAVNEIWKRRTLGWRTAYEAWSARVRLEVDRSALREEVNERAARIGRQLQCRGKPADLAERLAIQQALESRGYLRQQIGGWC
jgi:hypothetical protein